MDAGEIFQRIRERCLHFTQKSWIQSLNAKSFDFGCQGRPCIPEYRAAPDSLKLVLAQASEKLRKGEWEIFGWKSLSVGLPPQWNMDGLLEALVPVGEKTNHRTLPDGADARVVWEINRWTELVRLCMHAHVNRDFTCIDQIQDWLEDWIQKHPLGQGLPWRSALEGGIRLMNFAWLDALIEANAAALSDQVLIRQKSLRLQIVPTHVAWVQRYLSFGSSANNHRLGELVGLYVAMQRWPEVMDALAISSQNWSAEIKRCLLNQFYEDGGNKEQALHYQLFAMEMYWQAQAFGWQPDPEITQWMRRAQSFFVDATHPDEPWEYGDNDDAELIPLCSVRGKAIREWVAWLQQEKEGESIEYWLGKAQRVQAEQKGWVLKRNSGMAFYQTPDLKLRLDASELGYGKMAAHGHLDALHLSIWCGEKSLVIDPGTGGYFGSPVLRAKLASWEMHNGPIPVQGYQGPKRYGTFLWGAAHAIPELRVEADRLTASFSHESFQFQRNVEFFEESSCLRIEDTEAQGREFIERWILSPEASVTRLESPNELRFEIRLGGVSCFLGVNAFKNPVSVEIQEIEVSPKFGKLVKAKSLFLRCKGSVMLEWTLESVKRENSI